MLASCTSKIKYVVHRELSSSIYIDAATEQRYHCSNNNLTRTQCKKKKNNNNTEVPKFNREYETITRSKIDNNIRQWPKKSVYIPFFILANAPSISFCLERSTSLSIPPPNILTNT